MLISSALSILLSVSAAQSDSTTAPRNAYTACLRAFMDKSADDRISASAFETALPAQCSNQERAFREAVRRRESSLRTPAREIDQIISDEIRDAQDNMKQLFELRTTPA